MERKILFKAKRTDNGEWVKGDLVHAPFCLRIERWEDNVHLVDNVDPSTVCQFTGLTDMSGQEIWEHDLISIEHKTREILFRSGVFCIIDDDYKRQPLVFFAKAGEVQGSKFDKEKYKRYER